MVGTFERMEGQGMVEVRMRRKAWRPLILGTASYLCNVRKENLYSKRRDR
jgi:hypothetical protein